MGIGISTACYYPLETELSLEQVGKSGVKVTEIFFNSPRELKPSFLDMLADIRDYYGLRIASVHTFTATADSYLFYSNYQRRFEDGLDYLKKFYNAAAELGAKYVIMHGDKITGKLPDEEVAEHFMLLENEANSFGVHVLQENVNLYRSADPEFIRNLIKNTDGKALFCFDVKQAVRSGHTPDEILDAMGGNVRHVHLSDHSASSDCLLPGKGGFDFSALFDKLNNNGYSGDYVIEVYKDCYNDPAEIANSLKYFKNNR